MERSGYNSDVSDKQWERLQESLPELSTRGAHLRKWELQVIINAILYVVITGCQLSISREFLSWLKSLMPMPPIPKVLTIFWNRCLAGSFRFR